MSYNLQAPTGRKDVRTDRQQCVMAPPSGSSPRTDGSEKCGHNSGVEVSGL